MRDEFLLLPCRTYHLYATRSASNDLAPAAARFAFWQQYREQLHPFVDTYAYCLLPHHVHLLLRVRPTPPDGGLTEQCLGKVLLGSAGASASDWKRRDVFSDTYAAHLVQFIHRSPVRHGYSRSVSSYPHSSYATLAGRRPTRLRREIVHAWFGGADAFCDAHARRWSGCAYPDTPALDHVQWSVVS